MNFSYEDALKFINALQFKGIKPSLKNIAYVLACFRHYYGLRNIFHHLKITLLGSYQIENATLAKQMQVG